MNQNYQVEFSNFIDSKIQITPGTLAKYNPVNKIIQQQKVDTKYYTSWRDGALLFKRICL